MYKRILVPVDGSATSNKALTAALQLARDSGGRVRVLHSLDELAYLSGFEYSGEVIKVARETANKVLADALDVAKAAGVPADQQLVDQPGQRLGQTVADAAQAWEADLVVVGTHGRRGLGRVLMGSGAEQVIRIAPVPVLVIRGDAAEAGG
ncbi:universal stress protein [Caenimonas terrae]|uniref:Universal stress protein n=1 Tax=Caenimonas terrae TaxID=696074 RepID=A0ABW0NBU1_9BURK